MSFLYCNIFDNISSTVSLKNYYNVLSVHKGAETKSVRFHFKDKPTFKLSVYILKSFCSFYYSITQRFYVMSLFLLFFSMTNNCEHREKYCSRNICLTSHIIIGDAYLLCIYCGTTRVTKQHGKCNVTEGAVRDYGIYLWTRDNHKKVALLISVTIDFDICSFLHEPTIVKLSLVTNCKPKEYLFIEQTFTFVNDQRENVWTTATVCLHVSNLFLKVRIEPRTFVLILLFTHIHFYAETSHICSSDTVVCVARAWR